MKRENSRDVNFNGEILCKKMGCPNNANEYSAYCNNCYDEKYPDMTKMHPLKQMQLQLSKEVDTTLLKMLEQSSDGILHFSNESLMDFIENGDFESLPLVDYTEALTGRPRDMYVFHITSDKKVVGFDTNYNPVNTTWEQLDTDTQIYLLTGE